MKLYNLYEQVIFEEVQKHQRLITEGASEGEIDGIINGDERGRHYHVSFNYTNAKGESGERWVQIYDRVETTKDNPAISAYQISANGDESKNGWKIFLLKNMNNLKVSKVPFYRAISDANPYIQYTDRSNKVRNAFNKTGNATKTLKNGDIGSADITKVDFSGSKFSDSTLKRYAKQAADYAGSPNEPLVKPPLPKPIKATPVPVPIAKPVVRPMKRTPVVEPIVKKTTSDITYKPNPKPEEIGAEEEEEFLNNK